MTRPDQRQLVETVISTTRAVLINDIEQDRIPPEWDGYELRKLIAFRFADQCLPMDRKRNTEFMRVLAVENL